MKVKELGELKLIEHLAGILGKAAWGGTGGVVRGIGDDAAVLQVTPGHRLLASCDMLIEDKHFSLNYTTPYQLGWKALAVNLSDIAAMGGRPRWALLSVGIPGDTELKIIEQIYEGVAALALRESVAIVGGDTCASPGPLILDLVVLGEVPRGATTFRASAEVEDFILLTGTVGASAAGLRWLQNPELQKQVSRSDVELLLQAHLDPQPRCREAIHLAGQSGITAMIDLSDGLAAGLLELAAAGGVGMSIYAERLPILPQLVDLAARCGIDPLDWALYGGEDYELLFTVGGSPGAGRNARRLIRQIRQLTGTPVTMIGRVSAPSDGVRIIFPDGNIETLDRDYCYKHF